MQKQNLTLIGIILPSVWVGMVVLLILVSFVSIKVNSIISAESLILLTLAFSPVIYLSGTVISIAALAIPAAPEAQYGESKMKKNVLLAAGLNIALLVCWLYFSQSFLMEFELII